MTAKFLLLEREIDDYLIQVYGDPHSVCWHADESGRQRGAFRSAEHIELKATDLRDEAAQEMKKVRAVLAETQDD